MMNKKRAMPWWGWFSWILVIVLGCLTYLHLAGQANQRSPHLLAVAYEPAIMLIIILLWHVLWKIDPKRRNYASFWQTYRYIGGVIVVCIGLIYLTVLGHLLHVASMRLAPTAFGIMFMLIANVLPRLQPNWWVGFRTPWTLSNRKSWIRTHRLGGQLGVLMGILIIIIGWVLPTTVMMTMAVILTILLWVLIVGIASYFYAKKE
ncbi:immunity protein SdpI [Sporolactobacillus putidus]|uniref:Immunity protein SdpI n=2 Tax=Sporolactobacillus putidus TaxID=492735 RepID=A0A917S324_9BACL|nr:immunity protein SdpI [Sporolactobacillus putidus]